MDRRILLAGAGGMLAFTSGAMAANSSTGQSARTLTAAQKAAIAYDCSQTIVRFFSRLDAVNRRIALGEPMPSTSDDPWDLTTPDAVWRRSGHVIGSKEDFAAAVRGLPKGLLTSHQVVNFLVESVEPEAVSARFSLTIFDAIFKSGTEIPLLNAPDAILGCQVQFAPGDSAWRIRQMTSERLFYRPPAA